MDLTLALSMGKKDSEEFTDEEIARCRDEVIKRMANTPPKPHSEMKIGKRKAKADAKPSPGASSGAGKSKRVSK
jgi:hypothetical protein